MIGDSLLRRMSYRQRSLLSDEARFLRLFLPSQTRHSIGRSIAPNSYPLPLLISYMNHTMSLLDPGLRISITI